MRRSESSSMPNRTFGTRQQPPTASVPTNTRPDKYSRVDFLRGLIAALCRQYDDAAPSEHASLAMRIRVCQDQLAEAKRLSGARKHRSDEMGWVDIWRPN